ncbi:MAG TPA: phospholipase D-like domain-containing protein [Ktedonobacteraceae bacterium]|nr:phospholipase D-like domain-containing protein [Ktedonobacteraceae bacterium]
MKKRNRLKSSSLAHWLNWHNLRSLPTLLRRILIRAVLVLVGAQISVIGILFAIDFWRKRYRSQGRFPRTLPEPVHIGHSTVQLYTYGEDLYDAMLQAIRNARERVFLETFIWKSDRVGQQFKLELQRAADRGVKVYVIYDSFANLVVPHHFKQFKPNISVLRYPLFAWLRQPFYLSGYARDHRKILVVDGRIAFLGGYNIGSHYATEWRDTHLSIKGPDARELESVCIDFWNTYRKRKRSLPVLAEPRGRDWDPLMVFHRNDPHLLIFPIRHSYLEAINRATRHIYLTHAYFIPDRVILTALLNAAARGVDVRILLPATSNHILADWLARGYYSQCLAGGIRLFLYQNAMVHAKTATIDSVWSTIGTANLDRLSLLGNFEVNVEIYDEELAHQMEEIFLQDSTNACEMTLEKWRSRSVLQLFVEMVLLPLRPFL